MSRVRSLCAGPCTLPVEVLEALHAMPDEGVDELAGLMRDFARSPG